MLSFSPLSDIAIDQKILSSQYLPISGLGFAFAKQSITLLSIFAKSCKNNQYFHCCVICIKACKTEMTVCVFVFFSFDSCTYTQLNLVLVEHFCFPLCKAFLMFKFCFQNSKTSLYNIIMKFFYTDLILEFQKSTIVFKDVIQKLSKYKFILFPFELIYVLNLIRDTLVLSWNFIEFLKFCVIFSLYPFLKQSSIVMVL